MTLIEKKAAARVAVAAASSSESVAARVPAVVAWTDASTTKTQLTASSAVAPSV